MLPDVFALLNVAGVQDYVGTSPPRIYRHGRAPQGVAAPYVTWVVIDGVPENCLGDDPPVDAYSIQVDCWSDNTGTGPEGVNALALAVRTQIETQHHVTSVSGDTRDEDTQRYRVSLIFTIWDARS